jgi:cytochrome c553
VPAEASDLLLDVEAALSGEARRRESPLFRYAARCADQAIRGAKSQAAGWRAARAHGRQQDDLPRRPTRSRDSPCASCHGADAKGTGAFPRLAGQLHDYILKKLTNWSKERGQDKANPDASAIMEPIAHGLTASQIAEVAAYLSDLDSLLSEQNTVGSR